MHDTETATLMLVHGGLTLAEASLVVERLGVDTASVGAVGRIVIGGRCTTFDLDILAREGQTDVSELKPGDPYTRLIRKIMED